MWIVSAVLLSSFAGALRRVCDGLVLLARVFDRVEDRHGARGVMAAVWGTKKAPLRALCVLIIIPPMIQL